MSNSSRSTTAMIKLAPSPRDVPASGLSSPRSSSFRSSSHHSRIISPRTNSNVSSKQQPLHAVNELGDDEWNAPEISTDVFANRKQSKTSPKRETISASPGGDPAADGNNGGSPKTPEPSTSALPPPPAAAPASSTPTTPSTPLDTTTATRHTKRMIILDPKSGQKYHLHADDHSLTDKELHVYHKKTRKNKGKHSKSASGAAKRQPSCAVKPSSTFSAVAGARRRSLSDGTGPSQSPPPPPQTQAQTQQQQHQVVETDDANTLNTDFRSYGETLETASALTEVSYYGRYKINSGPFQCVIPTSCRSVEHMAFGDFIQYGNHAEEGEDQRDDVESVERERMKDLLEPGGNKVRVETNAAAGNGKKKDRKYTKYDDEGNTYVTNKEGNNNPQPPALLSPITNLISPRISSLAKSFFDNNTHFSVMPEGHNAKEIKFRRICLVVFPNEVQKCLEGNKTKKGGRHIVGLLGMKFEQNENDFQAHVGYVQRGSKAERMGVRKGDIVSFAVALSNMTEVQNSFLAEKLIKRLESVGMRTSYRELYDIFLSKTTNERPIGMVFRRWKNRGSSAVNQKVGGVTLPTNIRITDEFDWSTDFLQSLSIKCREYEFERKVPLITDAETDEDEDDLPLLTFLPRPNVDTLPKNGLMADYLTNMLDNLTLKYNCGSSPMMNFMESTLGVNPNNISSSSNKKEDVNDFLSNRILCSLVEQSMGLIFLRRTTSVGGGKDKTASSGTPLGSGFAVVRKAEGSWSAPCFLSILGSKDKFTETTTDNEKASSSSSTDNDVKMIVIRKKELVNNLISGNAVKFVVRKEERANVLVRDAAIIGVRDGRFQLANDFFMAVKVNDVQNQGAYSLSTDHIEASDILIGTISPPEQSVDFYGALQSLELPYSMHSHPVIPEMLQRYSDSDWVEFLPDHNASSANGTSSCGMRTKLQMISKGNSLEPKREVDIFARKLKYYLMDGVPVHRVLSSNNSGVTEEKVLRLTIKDPTSLFTSSLELTRKRRPGVSNVGIPSNFSTTFESITKLSRSPPASLEKNLDEEEKKRFFSIETDLSPGPVMMLAKSKKDAMILLCGLKLLLEREKMLS